MTFRAFPMHAGEEKQNPSLPCIRASQPPGWEGLRLALHVASLLMGQGRLQLINRVLRMPTSCNSFLCQRTLNRPLEWTQHRRAFQSLLVNELFCSQQREQCRSARKFLSSGVGRQACCQVLGQAWDWTGRQEEKGVLDAAAGVNDHLSLCS